MPFQRDDDAILPFQEVYPLSCGLANDDFLPLER